MATIITSECINCGACEPECPNTAIYQGAVEYEGTDGATHAAISDEIFYIVPEKCTECVGFHDEEACAAVCPVDCCVPDPAIPEVHDVLLALVIAGVSVGAHTAIENRGRGVSQSVGGCPVRPEPRGEQGPAMCAAQERGQVEAGRVGRRAEPNTCGAPGTRYAPCRR